MWQERAVMRQQKGFSLIELMIVTGVILIITGIAMPVYKTAMDTIHLQEAGRNYAGMLQRARITAVTNNTYNAVGIQLYSTSSDIMAYVDTAGNNPPAAYVSPEPMTMLGSKVVWNQPGAPATNDLLGKVFPNNGGSTLGYPPIFGSRGMPCAPVAVTGGTVCNTQGGNVAYATYFQSSLGNWEAVSVNPVGRIQLWSYDPNASVWNQL
jgi:prepilin-type N-terminal cleavage/methylation domain-containing protein